MNPISRKGILPLTILVLLLISLNTRAQNLDLIVTHVGDSIACRIDSISAERIYFEMKYNYNWGPAELEKEEYSEYKLKAINQDYVTYKPGTSFITSYREQTKPAVSDVYVPPKYQTSPEYEQESAEIIKAAEKKPLRKNLVNVNVGTLIIYTTITVNYERLIFGADPTVPVALYAKIGYGGFFIFDEFNELADGFGFVSAVLVTGKNARHFEGSIGYMFYNNNYTSNFQFSGAFRYQTPEKPIMIKVGGGFPEIVFFGIGYSF